MRLRRYVVIRIEDGREFRHWTAAGARGRMMWLAARGESVTFPDDRHWRKILGDTELPVTEGVERKR